MEKYTLPNGLTIIHDKQESKSVSIQITVKVGSVFEDPEILGMSHFIEHMLFEGTAKYTDSRIIANRIESLGGNLNAYTTAEQTGYHIKILKKHFDVALDLLAEIIKNPLFREKDIDRERKIILDEINMVLDEPRYHQWIIFEQTLYKKHPVRNPTYGTIEKVSKITKKQMLDFYHKHYTPNNMVVVIVGDVPNVKERVYEHFAPIKKNGEHKYPVINEPVQKENRIKKITKQLNNSYMILGFNTVTRLERDSYALDIIRAVLGRGQSGKMFHEIRAKRGLAYEVGVHHDAGLDYGHIAVYLGTDKKNLSVAKEVILEELKKIDDLSKEELNEAKNYIEGSHLLEHEDTLVKADALAFWEIIKDHKLFDEYIDTINSFTLNEVKAVAKKYFSRPYTEIIIEQKE